MRSTIGHLSCSVCSHLVNPRSQQCGYDHRPCTPAGCRIARRAWPVSSPVTATDAVVKMRAELAAPPTRLVDLASYQEGISLPAVLAAGHTAVNVKLTQGNWYAWGKGPAYAESARDLGMGVLGFMWLDNSAPGATQAAYAWSQAQKVGVQGIQVDCEDSARPATSAIWRDCVNYLQDKQGRHITAYTGDWWWTATGRNWNGAALTPYLWAAPNNGYLAAYPGDQSSQWRAGYGGWGDYALLQYSVSAVANAGGGNLSKTAIRDPGVWAALTGGEDVMAGLDDRMRYPDGVERDGKTALHEVASIMLTGKTLGSDVPAGLPALLRQFAATELSTDQMTALTEKLSAAIVAHPDVPLGDADKPAIVAAVKQALREGATGSTQGQ